jgi:hypothetical protein
MSKRRKISYQPSRKLAPKCLPAYLEPMAKDLYEKSCKGSYPLWDKIKSDPKSFIDNDDLKNYFLKLTYSGMKAAQEQIVNYILNVDKLDYSTEVLFRSIADSMAWMMIQNQLCYARALYQEQRQPDLFNSNLESVFTAANSIMDEDALSFALISDLTSFIQLGDIYLSSSSKGNCVIEVKSGENNHKLMNFLFNAKNDNQPFESDSEDLSLKDIKQMERIMRQTNRMSHYTRLVNKGVSSHPDTRMIHNIPNKEVVVESWLDDFIEVLNGNKVKDWSIGVIDDYIFVGSYTENKALHMGHLIFNNWFDNAGGTPNCPRVLLNDSMIDPLAPPVFALDIPEEDKFDVVFGRKTVCIGVVVDEFLKRCEREGLTVRFATNKEKGKLLQSKHRPYMYKGMPVYIGNGINEMVLMEGIFLRTLHHYERPISIIRHYLNDPELFEQGTVD